MCLLDSAKLCHRLLALAILDRKLGRDFPHNPAVLVLGLAANRFALLRMCGTWKHPCLCAQLWVEHCCRLVACLGKRRSSVHTPDLRLPMMLCRSRADPNMVARSRKFGSIPVGARAIAASHLPQGSWLELLAHARASLHLRWIEVGAVVLTESNEFLWGRWFFVHAVFDLS